MRIGEPLDADEVVLFGPAGQLCEAEDLRRVRHLVVTARPEARAQILGGAADGEPRRRPDTGREPDGALPEIEIGAVGAVALRADAVEVLAREPEVAAVGGGEGAAVRQPRPRQPAVDLPIALQRSRAVAGPVRPGHVEQPIAGAEREPAARRDAADEREEAAARRRQPRDDFVLEADRELLGRLGDVSVQVRRFLGAQAAPRLGPSRRARRCPRSAAHRQPRRTPGSGRRRSGRAVGGRSARRSLYRKVGAGGTSRMRHGTATAAWDRRGSAPAASAPGSGPKATADTEAVAQLAPCRRSAPRRGRGGSARRPAGAGKRSSICTSPVSSTRRRGASTAAWAPSPPSTTP